MPLAVPGAGKTHWEHGVRGLASPDPLLGAIPWRFHRSSSWTRCFCRFYWEARGDSTGAVFWTRFTCPSLWCLVPMARQCRTCGDPQVQFLDKLSMPVVGAWCSWPDSAENCGYAAVSVHIVASRATDHGEIVEVIQLLRCGVDCGVSCHRSFENRESDSAFAMRSRSWRLVPLIMEMSRTWRLVPQIMEVDVPVVQVHLRSHGAVLGRC